MTIELYVPIANPALWWALGGVAYFIVAVLVGRWTYRNYKEGIYDPPASLVVFLVMLFLPVSFLVFLAMVGNKPKE